MPKTRVGGGSSGLGFQDGSIVVVAIPATLTINANDHDGKTIRLDKVDGVAITLPKATGSGLRFRILIGATITSVGTTIKVIDAVDVMRGLAFTLDDDGVPPNCWAALSTSDTITMNGTTSGGYQGDLWEFEDMKAGFWSVQGRIAETGTEVTPFSATV